MATYSSLGADGELGEDHEERVGEGVSTHALSTMIGSKAGRVKACLQAGLGQSGQPPIIGTILRNSCRWGLKHAFVSD